MDRKNDTAPLNRKCNHCLRSSVRVHFVSARPEVRRFLLAKRILYIHYVFLPLFSREQYVPFTCRLRLVFVSSPCLAGRLTLFIYYLIAFRHDYFPVAAFFTIYTAHNTLFLKSRQFSRSIVRFPSFNFRAISSILIRHLIRHLRSSSPSL